MGGIGSGRWYRSNTITTTNEVHNIDIRFLKKRGFLKTNITGTLSWSRDGESFGSIRFKTSNDSLQLRYKHCQCGGDWIDRNERIKFDWTPCNYGGNRQWLLCPHCNKRVAVLYGLISGFLCRHCYKLPYASQGESYLDRMTRKTEKLRKRFDVDDYGETLIFHKPKGMHWQTFNRLMNEEQRIDALAMTAIERRILVLTQHV